MRTCPARRFRRIGADSGAQLPAVSDTAIAVAEVRARESSRPDALFHDPYADLFARRLAPLRGVRKPPAEPPDDEAVRRARGRAFHVIIRTCFYDDFLQAAAASGIRQAVLIGAGLDARAFRLGWPPGMTIFEVDLPGVLAAKQSVLDSTSAVSAVSGGVGGAGSQSAVPRAERRTVAADLTEPLPEPLLAAGFDPGVPVAWLAEGVLVYLEPATVHRLLGEITALSCPGSRFAAESGARRPGPADSGGVEALWLSGGRTAPTSCCRRWAGRSRSSRWGT